jgi:hypothetical protein
VPWLLSLAGDEASAESATATLRLIAGTGEPDEVTAWWAAHQKRATQGKRYLSGRPRERSWLEDVLSNGNQRARACAALDRVVAGVDSVLFELRAPGARQREMLGVS